TDPICPNGTTYNNATDLCEAGATCPEGDVTDDQCFADGGVTITDPICPNGTTYNNTTDLCEAGATCPEGDVTLDQCIETVDGICLEGFPNFTTDVCDGDLPNIGPITCPDGFTYSNANDVCEDFSDPICPNGTTYNNATDLCEAGATCPEGDVTDDQCEQVLPPIITDPICPNGSTYSNNNDVCEAGATCPEGDVTDDQCEEVLPPTITDPICPNGTTYNNATDLCEAGATCPEGDVTDDQCFADGGVTMTDPICPNGTTYNNATDLCEAGATCPEGTTLVNDWCEGPPMAVAGELLPTNSVALIVAGLSSMVWGVTAMAGVIVVGVVGAGIYLVIFKPHNN
ncbi:MAG: hypothetical protein OEL77_09205, partial [Nitrosopumilus sp.]|nr:hypothetical protein [Nitrosopumilus sp.]